MAISKKQTDLFFRLSISLTVFGALFKPLAFPLILIGVAGMIIFHSIQFFQKQPKLPLDYARHMLIVSFSCNYAFNMLQLPYEHIIMAVTRTSLIIFILIYLKDIIASHKKNGQNNLLLLNIKTENLSYLLSDLATVYIVIASLFKILNWEFGIINANLLLVIGLLAAVISILASSKDFGKQETSE